jgi:hypothetical protein
MEMEINISDLMEASGKSVYDLISSAIVEATRMGIKANSIVINRGLVFVPGDPSLYPDMVCGLKSHIASNELPEEYAFAVCHDPNRIPEPTWIPVSERLPSEADANEEGLVLVRNIGCPQYEPMDWDQVKVFCSMISHWMHLPDPPKEVTE